MVDTQADLQSLIEQQARKAIEAATEEVLDIFKEKYIQKMVYDSHKVNARYHDDTMEPTGQFKRAWMWTAISKVLNTLSTEMFYDPTLLRHDSSTFLHGSKYRKRGSIWSEDARETLMDILNKEGRSSSLWLSVSRPEAYFDRFIEDMFDNGELNRILTKHFTAHGFTPA